ncbi:chemotaxis protein CheW [Anaeromyxobacter paludicola]|uniref:CheW-like domain-containing protein n=1 Tax=Anaeromyxobacter paludicola TaxID=2918171 RepID=A0ABM7X5Y5_9BACT|nr:chemotaxis protein CheW [Anaeromyxobacter paludicola]BDG07231.1 hypothetical protein AMPC_03440 [Anaeromyxobacter paludicola]
MDSLPAQRQALLFEAGGVRLALRLSHVRKIVAAPGDEAELSVDGLAMAALPVAVALGRPFRPCAFAVVTESSPPTALRVERLLGILDLEAAEVFQLPARSLLPQPPPFLAAIVARGELSLELSPEALGWAAVNPAAEPLAPPPEAPPAPGRELLFERAGQVYAVPLPLLVQVVEQPRVHPVPLTPPVHLGLLYQGRALHAAFDLAAIYGDAPPAAGPAALLVDAGGLAVAVFADRVLGATEAPRDAAVRRPTWDALFAT